MTEQEEPAGTPPRRRPNRKTLAPELDKNDPRLATTDPDPVDRLYLRLRIHEAVARLPEYLREVFLLRHASGYGIEETAARLGRTEGAVRAADCRARKQLREHLTDLAPVIIGLLVLAMLLAVAGVTTRLEPVRPLPLIPRSQSGLRVVPYQAGPCQAPRAVQPLSGPNDRRLTVTVGPEAVAEDAGTVLRVTIWLRNAGTRPVNLGSSNMEITVYSRDGRTFLAHDPFFPQHKPLHLRPGQSRRFERSLMVEPCTTSSGTRLATHGRYRVRGLLGWHPRTGIQVTSWSSATPVTTVERDQKSRHGFIKAGECVSLADGSVYVGVLGLLDSQIQVKVRTAPDSSLNAPYLPNVVTLTNTATLPVAVGVTPIGVITSDLRFARDVRSIRPGKSLTFGFSVPPGCGTATISKSEVLVMKMLAPTPTDVKGGYFGLSRGGGCSDCDWVRINPYAVGDATLAYRSN